LLFRDRRDAGRHLARKLRAYADSDAVVLALPRGGVPVGYEVATALGLPLDVFIVRKLGLPGHEELAMGAIASGGASVMNPAVLARFRVPERAIEEVVAREREELQRREAAYRGGHPPVEVAGRTAILVDDGLATGSSMQAAVLALRRRDPLRIVVAVPVAPAETCREFEELVDDTVCAVTPQPFYAVGEWYEDFSQTGDEEVSELLARADEKSTEVPDKPRGDVPAGAR
jgi:putative phosphoribosyl transferase